MKNLKCILRKSLIFCSVLQLFLLLSCHNTKQNQYNYDFYTDDCYFIVDDFLGGINQGEALSKDVCHVLTVKSLSHKNLLQEKINWSFSGILEYDIKPQFFEKNGRNNSDINYYLYVYDANDEFEITLNYYDVSISQSFLLSDNHLKTNILLYNTRCFLDLDNPEYSIDSAFIFNSIAEYDLFRQSSIHNSMPSLNSYNIDFEHHSLAVFCGFYSFYYYSFEFLASFIVNSHIYFQSLITLSDNDPSFDPIVCKSYYLLIEKTPFNECSQNRLFSYTE